MKKIVWLASYPKSGNTWFRIFLANLLKEDDDPIDINHLYKTPIASSRSLFEEAVGFDASDLTHDEADRLRPEVYAHIGAAAEKTEFLKIHDAFTHLDNGQPLFADNSIFGAIYFIRNPLDVAVSYANHSGITIDESIGSMNNVEHGFAGKSGRQHNQLRQILLDWSGHVRSWVDDSNVNLHLVRYEDMKDNPIDTFYRAVEFAGIKTSVQAVETALEKSSFSELKRQEEERGFREKAPDCTSFFNRGQTGYWRQILSRKQADALITEHKDTMIRFGYLDSKGEPTV